MIYHRCHWSIQKLIRLLFVQRSMRDCKWRLCYRSFALHFIPVLTTELVSMRIVMNTVQGCWMHSSVQFTSTANLSSFRGHLSRDHAIFSNNKNRMKTRKGVASLLMFRNNNRRNDDIETKDQAHIFPKRGAIDRERNPGCSCDIRQITTSHVIYN